MSMTNLTPVIPAAAKIEQAGGPKWNDRICLRQGIVKTTCEISKASCPFVRNIQACEAAVIAYAMELCEWYGNAKGDCSIFYNLGAWRWVIEDDLKSKVSKSDTLLAASIALIVAVAERVGCGE